MRTGRHLAGVDMKKWFPRIPAFLHELFALRCESTELTVGPIANLKNTKTPLAFKLT